MIIFTRGYGQTDQPTDIATYRAAIAAKRLAPTRSNIIFRLLYYR